MKKELFGILIFILMISSFNFVFADNGIYNGTDKTVVINENNGSVVYDSVCVDKNQNINHDQSVNTTQNIIVKNGTIEYIIDNWVPELKNNTILRNNFQNGVWNISENTTRSIITYPDFFNYTKVVINESNTTTENIDGIDYIVTTWKTVVYNFLFRMVGDGHGTGYQDMLLFIVEVAEDGGKEKIPVMSKCQKNQKPQKNQGFQKNQTIQSSLTLQNHQLKLQMKL